MIQDTLQGVPVLISASLIMELVSVLEPCNHQKFIQGGAAIRIRAE